MPTKKRITIPCQKAIRFIELENILYCKAENCYTTIIMVDRNKYICSKTLSKLSDEIESPVFFRVSQSFLVNSLYIDHFDKQKKVVELKNGIKIPFTLKIKEIMRLINEMDLLKGDENEGS